VNADEAAVRRAINVWEPYAAMHAAFLRIVANLRDEELLELERTARLFDPTNCWWATYHVAELLAPEIRQELHRRALYVVGMFLLLYGDGPLSYRALRSEAT
jgi:hypothetical protein